MPHGAPQRGLGWGWGLGTEQLWFRGPGTQTLIAAPVSDGSEMATHQQGSQETRAGNQPSAELSSMKKASFQGTGRSTLFLTGSCMGD